MLKKGPWSESAQAIAKENLSAQLDLLPGNFTLLNRAYVNHYGSDLGYSIWEVLFRQRILQPLRLDKTALQYNPYTLPFLKQEFGEEDQYYAESSIFAHIFLHNRYTEADKSYKAEMISAAALAENTISDQGLLKLLSIYTQPEIALNFEKRLLVYFQKVLEHSMQLPPDLCPSTPSHSEFVTRARISQYEGSYADLENRMKPDHGKDCDFTGSGKGKALLLPRVLPIDGTGLWSALSSRSHKIVVSKQRLVISNQISINEAAYLFNALMRRKATNENLSSHELSKVNSYTDELRKTCFRIMREKEEWDRFAKDLHQEYDRSYGQHEGVSEDSDSETSSDH